MRLFSKDFTKISLVVLGCILIGDLVLSFLMYYRLPLDSDLIDITLPAEWYQQVLSDPFLTDIILSGEKYAGAGRFFHHSIIHLYYTYIPLFFQNFVDPVQSVYLASAVFQLFCHINLIVLIGAYIHRRFQFSNIYFLLSCCVALPFFHTNGYYIYIGIINHSSVYTFSYVFPLIVLAYVLFPFYKAHFNGGMRNLRLSLSQKALLWIALPFLAFNGPITVPVMLLIVVLYFMSILFSSDKSKLSAYLRRFDVQYFSGMGGVSLIAYYIGSLNTENVTTLPLIEGYNKLQNGIDYLFLSSPVYIIIGVLSLLAGILLYLNYRKNKIVKKYFAMIKYFLIFIMLFILIIPFGGYRDYRPMLIRNDINIPVMLLSILILGILIKLFFIKVNNIKLRSGYAGMILLSFVFLYFSDLPIDSARNDCEMTQLYKLYYSEKEVIPIDADCRVLSWQKEEEDYYTKIRSRMLIKWNILEEGQWYTKSDGKE